MNIFLSHYILKVVKSMGSNFYLLPKNNPCPQCLKHSFCRRDYKIWLKILLPLVDKFRTANWTRIKSDLQFSGILGLFPSMTLQN